MAEAKAPTAKKKKSKKKGQLAAPPPPPPDEGFLAWRTWAIAGVMMVGGVIAWKLVGTSYKHDVETICNAEQGSGFGIEHDITKVGAWVRDHLGTPQGNQLFATLNEAKVVDRPKKLQDAADGVHVAPCALVPTLQKLAAQADARSDMQHLCSEPNFPKFYASDDATRLTMLETWIDQNAKSPQTKDLGVALKAAPPGPERAKVLTDAANKLDVFSCANARSLEKPPPPVPNGDPVVRVGKDLQVVGGLREEDARKALEALEPTMLACYKDGITRRPDLAGTFMVKLELDEAGKIKKDEPGEGAEPLADQQTSLCLVHALRSIKLQVNGPLASMFVPLELTHEVVPDKK